MRFQLKGKEKGRTSTSCLFEFYFTIKLLNNCIQDNQSKSNAILIHTLIILDVPELLEQLMSVIFFDSKPSILYFDFQVSFERIRLNIEIIFYRNDVLDVSLLGIFDSIRLEPKHHLHQPWVIRNNYFLVTFNFELATELYRLVVCFVLLHANHVLY